MDRGQVSLRSPRKSMLASAGIVAGVRAAWTSGRDGYGSGAPKSLAANSAARRDLADLVPSLPCRSSRGRKGSVSPRSARAPAEPNGSCPRRSLRDLGHAGE